MKKLFPFALLFACPAGVVSAFADPTAGLSAAGDALDNIGSVKLKGYLGERLDAMVARHVVDTATFNFYASAPVDGFDMYSLYPRTDAVRIVSHTKGALKLRLRIPAWSAKTEVKLNGKAMDGVRAGSYFTLDHDWKLGDIVEMKFDMPVVAHTLEHHVAFTRGPVLLARDSRFADGDLTEPFRRGIKDGQAMPTFAAVRTPSDDFWMAFSATLPIGSHHANPEGANPETVSFCDYASAGNSWHRDNYYRTWFPTEWGPTE